MLRPLFLIALFVLWTSEMQGRTTSVSASSADQEKPATPRRVLFRTESPRLFAPQPPRRVAPTLTPVPQQRERPRSSGPVPTPRTAAPLPPAPEPKQTPSAPTNFPTRVDLGLQPTTFTPYDPYLGSVRSVISRLDAREADMVTACDLVRQGRQFRYLVTDPYRAQPPAVTAARHAGDCKSKALWLYDHLGDPRAYFVIGKLERRSRTSHAWVYWNHEGRWWILDPTDRAMPILADSVASHRYVPYYSYSSAGKFRHKATSLMLVSANGIPAAPSEPAIAVRSRSGAVKNLTRR